MSESLRTKFKFSSRGNFIGGEWVQPEKPSSEWTVKSPADLRDELGRFQNSYADIERAIDSAREAFRKWRKTDPTQRAEYLKGYQAALKRNEEEIIHAIARESGKPLWESKTEHAAMVAKVDITIQDSAKLVANFEIPGVMEDTAGACRYRPHGIMAVIGPFNFPGHLANGHIVPALLTGNAVIFKPSEKTPLTGQLMAKCFQEAELPRGVFNVIQGEAEVSRRLCTHEGIAGILFTGSYEVGTRIKQDTLQQHWKILALEMGGKNPALVWSDADLDVALRETLVGAYLSCGQRCSATSRILVHASLVEKFTERFHRIAKSIKIGHPMSDVFMGPLIDSSSVDRFTKFQGIAAREGAEVVMRGKALELESPGHYVTPSIAVTKSMTVDQAKKSVFQQTELFAPAVSITPVTELDEAIQLANCTQYGLVASVFSKSQSVYQACLEDLDFGLVNWNRGTVGATSRLPFGGVKKSGNHMPTASTATLYCAYPVSSLETPNPKAGAPTQPGITWE